MKDPRDASHILNDAIKRKGWELLTVSMNMKDHQLWRTNKKGTKEVKKFKSRKALMDYLELI